MKIDIDISCPLFTELNTRETVMLTHGDSVLENTVANDLNIIARSGNLISGHLCNFYFIWIITFYLFYSII